MKKKAITLNFLNNVLKNDAMYLVQLQESRFKFYEKIMMAVAVFGRFVENTHCQSAFDIVKSYWPHLKG